MGVSASQVAFAEELFAALGVSTRRMFGGAGLYAEGVMFALIDDSEAIFLKADAALRAELAAEGSYPWVYTYPSGPKAGQSMETGYMSLPDGALDEPAAACDWGRRALAVALKAQAAKPARKRR
jgi:DNA transformation protein